MAADLAISLATPFIEYLITPIGRQCGYILFYRSYLRDLEEGVDKLKDELKIIERKCVAEDQEKVTNWIGEVNGAVMEASTLLLGQHQPGENTVEDFQSWFKRCVCVDHPVTQLSLTGTDPLKKEGEQLPPENALLLEGARLEQVADAIAIPQDIDLGAWKRFYYLSPMVCYKKGRKAKKTMLVVQELNERIKTIGDISYEADTSQIFSGEDYETLRSRREITVQILKALSDAKGSVGVWGMGGIGKSTLMKEVVRLAQKENLFDDIAMAVVSQNPDVKKIQGELALRLGLKFKDDDNVSGRAIRLNKRLKPTDTKKSTAEPLQTKKQNAVRPVENQNGEMDQKSTKPVLEGKMDMKQKQVQNAVQPEENQDGEMGKKSTKPGLEGKTDMKQKQVLIILDDIWRGIDLEEIGIPTDAGTVKLLFTSRKQHVLFEMGCRDNFIFKLEALKDKEPWQLFERIVGEKVGHDGKFKSIAEEVVEKCGGLPVVLNAIATTLKNCSLPEWEDVLVQFKGSKDAYSNLEISYRHLESDELKSLFLVCVLLDDADICVQTILYYSMGLGILKGTNTVRSARDKLKALFHDLQDSSLLLKDDNNKDPDYIKIHDVVREVGIRIASKDQDSHLIADEFELKEIPRKKLKKSKAISIPYVNFRKLPEGWECPELRLFLVNRRDDDPPISISDSFFEGMKELSVLVFTGNCGDSLPSSIQLLLSLNTLCLDSCSIKDLTIIGKLKQLQILTFIGSEIARLPREIGELSELKVLNLNDSKLEIIEPQVLGKLTSLEELHLKGSSFIRWEDEEEMQPSNAKVSELNNLSNLRIVNIHIHNPSTIPEHLEFGNFAEYIIQIGDVWDWTGDYSESRTLKIKLELCHGSFLHEKWVQDLLKHTQDLHLDGIKGWQRSIHELCLDGFQELKHLHLQNSSSVQCVARSISNWLPYTAFTVLESLFLENLTGLEMISRGPIEVNSFSKLKVIKVIDCGKLKNLFTYSMLKGLSQLKEIEVRDCEALQVIVTVDSVATNTETIVLQALDRIELHNLPNIMTFCSNHRVEVDQTEVMPRSLEIVQEVPCIPTSTMFPNDQLVLFPQLKSLILSSLPKVNYIWQNHSSDKVANLEYLEVRSCDDLLIVIPSSLIKEVMKLETLMVRDCGLVQEVFGTSDGVALNLTSDVEILSRLNSLELHNLPFLKHIWENNHLKEKVSVFPNLKLLTVVRCRSLEILLPSALLKSLNQLTNICIKNCKKMKAVIPHENDRTSGETKSIVFQSLVDIWLEGLPSMVTFLWTKRGESINFPSLKELYVKNCVKMRSFSLLMEDVSAHELCFFDHKVLFPKLVRLDLITMRSIQKIWHEEILEESFCQLEILRVAHCQILVDVIPSINMTGISRLQFHNLKNMDISHCNSIEEPIFKFAVEKDMGKDHYSLSQLEKLRLHYLPKLKHVVQPDSYVVVGFQSLVEISVACCGCVIELFPIATAATLSKLEDLQIICCFSMTQIFGKDEAEEEDEMLDSILFPYLRSIEVFSLHNLISIFLGISCMLGFPSLEVLNISLCSKLTSFVQSHTSNDQTMEQSSPLAKGVHCLFDDKVELPNLKKLELSDLANLQAIWNIQIPYHKICDRIGKRMEITIKNCENLEEFILESDNGEKEIKITDDLEVFHSLADVRLENLPNMLAFIRGRRDQSINFSSLKEFYVENCPKMRAFSLPNTEESGGGSVPLCFFDHKALFPKLERLEFLSVGSMEKIWHEEIPQKSFCRIEKLIIKDCKDLVNIFPSNMMGLLGSQFHNLKMISANGCMSLEGSLFDFVGEEKGKGCKMSLPQLEKLWLANLPKLQHVVEPSSNVVCSFPNLVEVRVGNSPCVIDLFPISTAPTLSKLETLVILKCGSMRQVFGKCKVEEEKEEEMMMDDDPKVLLFPCLRSIQVDNLDNLICFFSVTSSVLHFPSLEVLEVSWCPKLKAFAQRYTVDELEESAAFIDKGLHYLFDDKVRFPKVKKLKLASVGSIEHIWHEESFFQLESLIVTDCQNLVNVFPSKCVTGSQELRFQKLKQIIIRKCSKFKGSLFEFVWEGEEKGNSFSLPQLEKLWLFDLPKLEHVIHPTPDVFVEFQSLVDISIAACPCVTYLLPSATAAKLSKLEKVKIDGCSSMRYVFGKEAAEDEDEILLDLIIPFPCLRTILLQRLDSLICFFFAIDCQFDFPSLEDLDIAVCPVLKTFVQRHKSEDIHYFFDDKVRFLKVKQLRITSAGSIEKIWHEESFFEPENLVVKDCQNLVNVFPSKCVTGTQRLRFQKLKQIIIIECSSLEGSLFECVWEGDEKGKGFSLPQLEKLWLLDLPKLKHVIHPTPDVFVELQSLVDIAIADCHCLIDLLPNATTAIPSKLENVRIGGCSRLRYVFGKEPFEDEDEILLDSIISFPCLRTIQLQQLDSLICFFLAIDRCQLDFPSLEDLEVDGCPVLKTFVQRHKSEDVHYLFDNKVKLAKLKKMYLNDLSSLQSIWKIQPSSIDTYDGIRQIVEIHMKNCDKLEEFIFESDDGETEIKTTYDPVVFHSLDNVYLQHLPNMVAFVRSVRRDRSITFPSLKKLYIETCPKMRAFYLSSTKESGDESLPLCFFDHKVLVPKVVQLDLISMGSIEKIWHEEISEESFFQLEELVVKDCQILVKVFPSKYETRTQWLRFQNLKIIIICECSSFEGSLFEFVWEGEEKGKSFSLPQLEKLWLFDLPKLEHVIHPTPDVSVEFQSLVDISIADCQCLIDFLPTATATVLTKLERVQILRCSSMRYVFGKEAAEDYEDGILLDTIISFSCLRTIQLQKLDSLICFLLAIDCQLDFPSLEDLEISWCPVLKTFVQRHKSEDAYYLFDDKVRFLRVEKLKLTSVGSIKKIWHEESFFEPGSLIVKECQNLVNVFPSKCVTGTQRLQFQKLKEIIIRECSSLEGSLFEFVWEGLEKRKGFSLPQLEKLWLSKLPKLEHVIHPTPDVFVEFQSLVDISIADCQCLIDLLPSATTAILSKLEKVKILRCRSMRYVFGKEAAEDYEDEILLDLLILFPCLRTIQLQELDSLISFFLAIDFQLDFPSLEDLEINCCSVLKTFVQRHKSEDMQYLFDDKVRFPKVERLKLTSVGSIRKIWHEESFFEPGNLIVKDCQNLVNVFPSKCVTGTQRLQFQKLKQIIIHECSSLEGSLFEFVWEGEEKRKGFSLPQLEKLWLSKLPKLEHVIHPTPDVFVELQSLVDIAIAGCHCLIDLLPNATTAIPSKLENVRIGGCSRLRYVFGKEPVEDEDEILLDSIISFPCLRTIQLQRLDSLICFFLAIDCQLDFPSLEDLEIDGCPVLKTFVQRHKSEDVHDLFYDKVRFPKVERLKLTSVGSIKKIWHEESFFEPESLIVKDCQNLVNVFPSKCLTGTQRLQFQKLKKIIIRECSSLEGSLFEFVWEGEEKGKGFSLPQLEKLWLSKLPKLEHVIHPTPDVFVEFQSLVDISIQDCQCLIDVLPSATAAILSKLEKVQILRCISMRYVFGKDAAEDDEDEILLDLIVSFPCLHTVKLRKLDSLICFFLAIDCQLDFPTLEDLEIDRCPVLKTFVQRHKSEDIRYLFDNKVEFPILQKMKLYQLSSLQTIWKNHVLLPSSSSCSRLKSLIVSDCNDLQHIFPSNLLADESLSHPQERFAFGGDGNEKPLATLTAEDGELVISFRELEHLTLHILPNLKSFSSANCTFELPSLEEVIVTECPNLEVFSSNTVVAPKLSKVLLTEKEQTGKVRWDGDLNTTIQNLPK